MGVGKEPKTVSEFLDSLSEFLGARPEESKEEIGARLKAEGLDPERVVARVRQLVDSKLKESRLEWREKARRERQGIVQDLADIPFVGKWTRDEMLTRVRQILAGDQRSELASAYFRNFERITDNDLHSLLEDFERMTKLEKQIQKRPGDQEGGESE